jgi:hypothetical protein
LSISGPAGAATLSPIGGPIAAKTLSAVDRAQIGDTLNFEVSWQLAQGPLACKLHVFDPDHPADSRDLAFSLDFVDVPPLDVHSVLLHYRGPDYWNTPVDVTATSLDVLVSLDYVLRTYPISDFNFDGCEVLDWTEKVATSQGIADLFAHVGDMRAMSGSNDIYICEMPGAVTCSSPCGLGGDGVALYFTDNGPEASHEIGHALGRSHTQCAITAGGADPNYPSYPGLPQGSIGEVGVDVRDVSALDPHSTFDFMSYCGPVWVSPYTYLALKDAVVANGAPPQPFQRTSPWVRETEFYHLGFRLHRGQPHPRAEIRSAFHITRQPPRQATDADIVVELVDANGHVLDIAPAVRQEAHADANDPFVDYRIAVPRPSNLHAFRIVGDGVVIGSWQVAPQAPLLAIAGVEPVKSHGNRMRIAWRGEAEATTPALSYGVRYSCDGKRWRALAVNLTTDHFVVDLDQIPGGDACQIQIVASAGFRTTVVTTEPFAVARKPRVAHLQSPKQGASYKVGTPIPLVGAAFSPDHGATAAADITWTTSAVGSLGMGRQVVARDLPVGTHRITMHAPDGTGGEVTASVEIRVVAGADCGCHRAKPMTHGSCGCRR